MADDLHKRVVAWCTAHPKRSPADCARALAEPYSVVSGHVRRAKQRGELGNTNEAALPKGVSKALAKGNVLGLKPEEMTALDVERIQQFKDHVLEDLAGFREVDGKLVPNVIADKKGTADLVRSLTMLAQAMPEVLKVNDGHRMGGGGRTLGSDAAARLRRALGLGEPAGPAGDPSSPVPKGS